MKLFSMILSFPLLLSCLNCAAQAQLPEWGKADLKELQLQKCDFDTDAPAMVIFDSEEISFRLDGYNLKTYTERRVRIKIFSEKGFEYANVTVPYLGRRRETRIKDISGITYNLDSLGNIVTSKIEKKQIFRGQLDENVRKLSFTFPNVKPGSVIEYRYTKVETNSMDLNPWIIQDRIPVKNSFYYIVIPDYLDVNYRIRASLPLDKKDTTIKLRFNAGTEQRLMFRAQNVLAFAREPFMSSVKDNIQRVEFSLFPALSLFSNLSDRFKWSRLSDYMYRSQSFGKQFKIAIKGTDTLINNIARFKEKDEKISYLFNYLRKEVKWNGSRSFYAGDLQECWDKKAGNSADLNLLFLNLLKKSGIEAHPILVSTRDNGKPDKEFVSLGQFNGVNVWIPDSNYSYVLDLTQKHTSHLVPPMNILFREAFSIDSLGGRWIYIYDHRTLLKTMISVRAVFNDSTEKITGQAAVFLYDYAREEALKSRDEEEDEEEKEERARKLVELTTYNYSEENEYDVTKPLLEKFDFDYIVGRTNEFYYFNPMFLSSLRENPFTANTRQTDIDLGCNQQFLVQVNLAIPEGFVFDHIPAGILLRNSDTSIAFKRQAMAEGNNMTIKITLDYNYPHFSSEEYGSVKEFYKKLFALLNEQIVFRRKKQG